MLFISVLCIQCGFTVFCELINFMQCSEWERNDAMYSGMNGAPASRKQTFISKVSHCLHVNKAVTETVELHNPQLEYTISQYT